MLGKLIKRLFGIPDNSLKPETKIKTMSPKIQKEEKKVYDNKLMKVVGTGTSRHLTKGKEYELRADRAHVMIERGYAVEKGAKKASEE